MTSKLTEALMVVALAVASYADGWFFAPRLPDVVRISMDPAQPADFDFGNRPVKMYGILIDGSGPQVQGIPPRCRNVPKGSGCIDWLEHGEKTWPEQRDK